MLRLCFLGVSLVSGMLEYVLKRLASVKSLEAIETNKIKEFLSRIAIIFGDQRKEVFILLLPADIHQQIDNIIMIDRLDKH